MSPSLAKISKMNEEIWAMPAKQTTQINSEDEDNSRLVSYTGGLPQHKLKLVIEYVHAHLEREVSLGELAAIAQLTQFHFCRAFKQTTGLSPHQYLIKQRVERAKQLLKSGKMKISEVAVACGFTHQSHMHRHFKRLTGITPRAWMNS